MVIILPPIGSLQDLWRSCLEGKQKCIVFPFKASHFASQYLELVHMDLCGPMQTPFFGGSIYFMLIVDDLTWLTWVFFLHHQNEAFPSFVSCLNLSKKELGRALTIFWACKGGVSTSNLMSSLHCECGINQEFVNMETPSKHGVI